MRVCDGLAERISRGETGQLNMSRDFSFKARKLNEDIKLKTH